MVIENINLHNLSVYNKLYIVEVNMPHIFLWIYEVFISFK